jgi:hypothetical protein
MPHPAQGVTHGMSALVATNKEKKKKKRQRQDNDPNVI